MTVEQLIALLSAADPEAEVVVLDRSEDVRFGLLRPLQAAEVQALILGRVQDDMGSWVCPWQAAPADADVQGPVPGLLLGPG